MFKFSFTRFLIYHRDGIAKKLKYISMTIPQPTDDKHDEKKFIWVLLITLALLSNVVNVLCTSCNLFGPTMPVSK